MKFSLSWLGEHLQTDAEIQQIDEALTQIGLEVDEISDPSAVYEPFIVAEVKACEKHPDADRLNVCQVYTGTETLQVVCGAPNVRAGLKIVFAPVGTCIPANDLVLKKAKIRGVESNGMICSEAELELSDEADGIMELPAEAPVGEKFAAYWGLNDPVIDIELTPDRADCAGVRGVARDLAAVGLGDLKPLDVPKITGTGASEISVTIADDVLANGDCTAFHGRVIRGVKNGPSPKWLQQRLTAAGLTPISALVDITNYLCLGINRPLHVFDIDKISGDGLVVRYAKEGEKLNALDEKTYTLDMGMVVIADDNGAEALGGVMGGSATGCDEATTNIFIESAYFNPDSIRVTGQKLMINSDAKYRFERGIDPTSCPEGLDLATKLIIELCGGEASEAMTVGHAQEKLALANQPIAYRPHRTETLGGLGVDPSEQKDILARLGFDITESNDVWHVTAPTWRVDIETEACIVEEVLRIKGFDAVPIVADPAGTAVPALDEVRNPNMTRAFKARQVLVTERGLLEAVTWAFMAENLASKHFTYADTPLVKLTNPLSEELNVMRQTAIPNLLQAAQRNDNRSLLGRFGDAALFEVGSVFLSMDQNDTAQPMVATILRFGSVDSASWHGAGRDADAFDAKADVLAVLESCGLNAASMPVQTRDLPSWYHPGQAAAYDLGRNRVAVFGALHPRVLDAMGIDKPVVAAEVFLSRLPAQKFKSASRGALMLSSYQPVTRDFAFVVANDIAADQVLRTVQTADKKLISHVNLFDVYTGKGVKDGHKSLALSVTLTPTDETLTDAKIDAVASQIVTAVEKKCGGSLR